MLYQPCLDSYLTPPIAKQGLGILPDGIGRGLIGDSQRNALVLTDAVAVGIEDTTIVQKPVGSFDVLGKALIVGGRNIARRAGDQIACGLPSKTVELLRYEAAVYGHRHGLANGA